MANLTLDQHLYADEPNPLNFCIKQENGTKQRGTARASQEPGHPRMHGTFSKPVEKEATFRENVSKADSGNCSYRQVEGLGCGLAECGDLKEGADGSDNCHRPSLCTRLNILIVLASRLV